MEIHQDDTTREKLLTIHEVAEMLSLKPSTAYQMVKTLGIPHFPLGRLLRFRREDIEAWLEVRRVVTALPRTGRRTVPPQHLDTNTTDTAKNAVMRAIERARKRSYHAGNGKTDQIQGLQETQKGG